uniref:Uncharacterized protein n=1 Tax=Lotus japonicus TaxID=34305 RepID=I3S703_LOTJA|nr:unknown [Lotus japonicus]
MKQEIQVHLPEVQEISNQAPKLILLHHQSRVQIQMIGRNNIKGASDGGDNSGGEIGTGNDGHLLIPFFNCLSHCYV